MKSQATESETAPAVPRIPTADSVKSSHTGRFIAVVDSRNRRVPGLCQRNGRYYGQLWIERSDGGKSPRRFPLTIECRPVNGITEAKEALEVLRHQRREATLPTEGRKPTFADFADTYLASGSLAQKKVRTRDNERLAIDRWKAHLGTVRIDKITPALAASFKDKRLKGKGSAGKPVRPVGPRTVNLDLIVLRNVLAAAKEAGHIREVPAVQLLVKLPAAKRKSLISSADFNALLAACRAPDMKNGEQLIDYLRFLCFTGAREQEALCVSWDDVDETRQTVAIGTDGAAKNRETRLIDFNSDLAALLKEMKERRQPDSRWLFPSPQRGTEDKRAQTLRESFKRVRAAANLPHVGFHHLRVMFISRAVMAGIDYLTIATWVGHKDGGVLIGKTYGRLKDEHKKSMAVKLGSIR